MHMFFILRQIQEKCQEPNEGLYIIFFDLTKAVDTLSKSDLCKALNRSQLAMTFKAPFIIANDVKQNVILPPVILSNIA